MSMTEAVTSRTYDLWSKFYDGTFGRLVEQRQIRAIEQLKLRLEPGQKVLDIGVGTGLTLRHYPRDVMVVGMDLSAGMLDRAREKRDELALDHCQLVRGDAMLPPFAPASFDHVIICHTISVVSDASRLLQWAATLIKPAGSVIVLNHFQSSQPVIGWFEKVLNPLFMKIGWRSDLALESVVVGSKLDIDYMFKLSVLDFWRIVSFKPRRSGQPNVRPTPEASRQPATEPSVGRAVTASS